MNRLILCIALGTAVALSGCAGKRPPGEPAAAASAQEAPVPATPPVKVPAAAARQVVLAMAGPQNVVQARDWAAFQQEWRETFAEHAKQAGIGFRFVDGPGRPQAGEDGTLLQVTVNDYRMVGIGSRILFGAMTGNAFIDARIRFVSLRDGTVFGEQQQNTTSSFWSGITAMKMTPQQVDAIAADVFKDIRAARP